MTSFTVPAKQPPPRSKRKKELYRLLVARSDIHAAAEACKLLLEMVPGDPLFSALFSALVVCYARPFTNNAAFGALPEKWRTFEDARMLQMHEALVKARHELIAHSDMSARRARIVPKGIVIGKFGDDREREERASARGSATTSSRSRCSSRCPI